MQYFHLVWWLLTLAVHWNHLDNFLRYCCLGSTSRDSIVIGLVEEEGRGRYMVCLNNSPYDSNMQSELEATNPGAFYKAALIVVFFFLLKSCEEIDSTLINPYASSPNVLTCCPDIITSYSGLLEACWKQGISKTFISQTFPSCSPLKFSKFKICLAHLSQKKESLSNNLACI